MELFLTVVGVVMIIEGIPYFAMPEQVKSVALKITGVNRRTLRLIGFSLMIAGLLTVAAARL